MMSLIDQEPYMRIMDRHRVIMTPTWLLPDPDNIKEMIQDELALDKIKDYTESDQSPNEPIADILYSVLETRINVMVQGENPSTHRCTPASP